MRRGRLISFRGREFCDEGRLILFVRVEIFRARKKIRDQMCSLIEKILYLSLGMLARRITSNFWGREFTKRVENLRKMS